MAILDERSRDMHSLNASAAAVWEACGTGATLAQIKPALERRFGGPVADDAVSHALEQLQRAKLVESPMAVSGAVADVGRRAMLKRLGAAGAMAIPVVVTLAASEQRVYAQAAGSRNKGED